MESIELFIVIAMVLVNAIFAAYEIALASVSPARLQVLHEGHRRGSAAALYMKEEIEKSLAVVQLGITSSGVSPPHHLSAWVAARLKIAPRGGEVVWQDQVRVIVRKVRRQNVLEAAIQRTAPSIDR